MGSHDASLNSLRLFLTVEHPCNYLPGRAARNLVADPDAVDNALYGSLARLGFRRSGSHVYRPHCVNCEACLSVRIPASAFHPTRAQRRIWARNRDLEVGSLEPRFHPEHYRLFLRYLRARHPDGGMDDTTPDHYLSFIVADWSQTRLYEFRLERRLLAVAVVDEFDDAFSAVYTFFDPDEPRRGLGTYAILWEIQEARRRGLQWVYLGYWIRECRKMTYKANFQPQEVLVSGRWRSAPP